MYRWLRFQIYFTNVVDSFRDIWGDAFELKQQNYFHLSPGGDKMDEISTVDTPKSDSIYMYGVGRPE